VSGTSSPPLTVSGDTWLRRNGSAILLVVLAFGIPELLTGSTPIAGLVTTLNLELGIPLYGSGVLLAREASLRWGKGWVGVLLLGLAYGIVEEGITTKTMVNPAAGAAGQLGSYGHFLGVNWIFAVEIDLFHAVYSIVLPILLVGLLWPERRAARFLSDRGLAAAAFVLGAMALLGFFVLTRFYFAPVGVTVFLLAVIGVLAALFFLLPRERSRAFVSRPTARPCQFGWVGAGFIWTVMSLALLSPIARLPPALAIGAMLLVSALTLYYVLDRAGESGNELHQIAFVAGLLSFWVLWDIVLEFLGDVGVLVVPLLLYWLLYRLDRRYSLPASRSGPPAAAT
jgi:hypothetical protein